ncbi:MAG: hypothetical protein PF569_04465 [Candidatus Woesearchaeota archaeon]|jgi:RNase P subunit RPR2|nr:hypothetical protein [Candidatus Woesearchaeota archaeon]
MKNKEKKQIQTEYAKANIQQYFSLIEKKLNPKYETSYIKEIIKLSQAFNITLKREEKLKYCKKCHIIWTTKTREIRLNSNLKTKEYICKNCDYVKRFKYSK